MKGDQIFSGHCKRLIPSHALEPTKQQLFTASGASLPLIGELELKFQVGGIWTFARVVVSEAIDELIFGIDWLRKNNCTWNFGRGLLELQGSLFRLRDIDSKNSVQKLFVSENTVVPAKQQSNLPVLATMPSLHSSGIWAVKPKNDKW